MTLGQQIRDFIPVEDAAGQLLHACHEDVVPGAPLVANLGTGRPQTLRAFAEDWWSHWQARGTIKFGEVPYREGEVMRYAPEILK